MSDNFKLALTFINKLSEGKKNFDGINLAGAVLEGLSTHAGSSLNRCNFRGCRLVSSTMSGISLKSTIFDEANLQEAVIVGSNCQRATFRGANLSRANFSKSRLCGANFSQANLHGANLQQADVRGADFRGSTLSQVELRGAFYNEKTLFDPSINPSSLGMRNTSQDKGEGAVSNSNQQLKSRPSAIQKAKAKAQPQNKEMFYRGVRVSGSEKKVTSTPLASAPKEKEIFYRGTRVNRSGDAVASTQPKPAQVQDSSKKPGLTYRGVKI